MKQRTVSVAAVVIAAFGITACSSGSAAKPPVVTTSTPGSNPVVSTTTATLSIAQYAAKYEAIVAPANTAMTTMQGQANALPSSATAAQLTSIVAPVIVAANSAVSQLAAIQWPGQAEMDIRTLITDDGNFVGDLTALESANALTASSVETKMSEDNTAAHTAADLVHADLGIPQSSSS